MHRKLAGVGRVAVVGVFAAAVLMGSPTACEGEESGGGPFSMEPVSLWKAGVGSGFKKGTQELNVLAGGGVGLQIFGSRSDHDWAIGIIDYGWMLTDVLAEGRWYQGNLEILAELFGGEQFHPDVGYFVGAGPHLRYNFATGTRLVPFIDIGGGVTATDIRNGDLSTTFQFNLQAALGTHWFLRDDLGLTFQWRFIHLSNAGIDYPNLGVNNSSFLLGLSWLF